MARPNTRLRPAASRGLTLIEILIVIAILLALGGLVAVNLIPRLRESKINIQKAQFDQIDAAMQQFRLSFDRWPTEDEGLAALWDRSIIESEDEAARWSGPYLEDKTEMDQWDHELIYEIDGEVYTIRSIGPDGEEGTDDDITNRKSSLTEDEGMEMYAPPPSPGGSGGSGGASSGSGRTGG